MIERLRHRITPSKALDEREIESARQEAHSKHVLGAINGVIADLKDVRRIEVLYAEADKARRARR